MIIIWGDTGRNDDFAGILVVIDSPHLQVIVSVTDPSAFSVRSVRHQ